MYRVRLQFPEHPLAALTTGFVVVPRGVSTREVDI